MRIVTSLMLRHTLVTTTSHIKLVVKSIKRDKTRKHHKVDCVIEKEHKPKKELKNRVICEGRDKFHVMKYPISKEDF